MRHRYLSRAFAGLAASALLTGPALAQYEIVIPTLDYRTGPFAPNGIPFANGQVDYYMMLNERDGGINGIKIKTGLLRDGLQYPAGRRVLREDQGY